MSKIVRLTSENIKRLSAVEIAPDGNVVVIGGKNGQGKSSVLDSIQYALGGDTSDKMPVRRGEDKGKVVVDLGDIIVRRTFTAAGGTSLVVTNADGVKQSSPQAILDKLVGKLTFDPLSFSREKPARQAEILRSLVGLDFTAQDAERVKSYDERTALNREAKQLEARMNAMPKHDAPETETDVASVLAEQQEAASRNAANEDVRRAAREGEALLKQIATAIKANDTAIANNREAIAKLEKERASLTAVSKSLELELEAAGIAAHAALQKASKLTDIDLAPFKAKASEVESVNRKVRENRQRAEVVAQYKAKVAESEAKTRIIEDLESKKRRATTEAKYPVEGLMFDTSGGVTLNGIPFDQASAAEQLKVSVAIGLALNPKLKVLLIRDGSLLDDDSLAMLCAAAKAADAQVWIERVGTDSQTSVVIEDGHIAAATTQPDEGKLL